MLRHLAMGIALVAVSLLVTSTDAIANSENAGTLEALAQDLGKPLKVLSKINWDHSDTDPKAAVKAAVKASVGGQEHAPEGKSSPSEPKQESSEADEQTEKTVAELRGIRVEKQGTDLGEPSALQPHQRHHDDIDDRLDNLSQKLKTIHHNPPHQQQQQQAQGSAPLSGNMPSSLTLNIVQQGGGQGGTVSSYKELRRLEMQAAVARAQRDRALLESRRILEEGAKTLAKIRRQQILAKQKLSQQQAQLQNREEQKEEELDQEKQVLKTEEAHLKKEEEAAEKLQTPDGCIYLRNAADNKINDANPSAPADRVICKHDRVTSSTTKVVHDKTTIVHSKPGTELVEGPGEKEDAELKAKAQKEADAEAAKAKAEEKATDDKAAKRRSDELAQGERDVPKMPSGIPEALKPKPIPSIPEDAKLDEQVEKALENGVPKKPSNKVEVGGGDKVEVTSKGNVELKDVAAGESAAKEDDKAKQNIKTIEDEVERDLRLREGDVTLPVANVSSLDGAGGAGAKSQQPALQLKPGEKVDNNPAVPKAKAAGLELNEGALLETNAKTRLVKDTKELDEERERSLLKMKVATNTIKQLLQQVQTLKGAVRERDAALAKDEAALARRAAPAASDSQLAAENAKLKQTNKQLHSGVNKAVSQIQTLVNALNLIEHDKENVDKEKQVIAKQRDQAIVEVQRATQQIGTLMQILHQTKQRLSQSSEHQGTRQVAASQVQEASDAIATSRDHMLAIASQLQHARTTQHVQDALQAHQAALNHANAATGVAKKALNTAVDQMRFREAPPAAAAKTFTPGTLISPQVQGQESTHNEEDAYDPADARVSQMLEARNHRAVGVNPEELNEMQKNLNSDELREHVEHVRKALAIVKDIQDSEEALDRAKTDTDRRIALRRHLSLGKRGLALLKLMKARAAILNSSNAVRGRAKVRRLIQKLARTHHRSMMHIRHWTSRALSVTRSFYQESLLGQVARAYTAVADLEELASQAKDDQTRAQLLERVKTAEANLRHLQQLEMSQYQAVPSVDA